MKALVITLLLLFAYSVSQAQLKGVPFDEAVPLEEVEDKMAEELYNILIKVEEDGLTFYSYVYEVKGKGYFDALKRLSNILNANNISRPADIDDSYFESHVDVNDYNEIAYQLRMELGWIEQTWFAYDDSWKIIMAGSDEAIAVAVANNPNRFERESGAQRQDELKWQEERERLWNEQERIELERQQQAKRLNNLGRDAFGRQGDPNGRPDSDNYSTGGGPGNNPFSYGLGSRKARGAWPLPNTSSCDVTQKIEVTVDIQVDRDGNVINAAVSKATYQNKCIWDMVVEAALKSKFSPDQAAAYRQAGWIRYIITP